MKSWIFIGILISVMGGAAYYYYSSTQKSISELIVTNTTLKNNMKTYEEANRINEETILELQSNYDRVIADYILLQDKYKEIETRNSMLADRLSEHDLEFLSYSKPRLVENIVNNATDNVNRCFEIISGSNLTEKERNATTSKQFNSECPWLFDPSR